MFNKKNANNDLPKDLINDSAQYIYPETLANFAAENSGVKTTVYNKEQIKEMGRRMSYNKEELALSDLGLTTQEITKYHMMTKRSFLDSWKMKNLLKVVCFLKLKHV